MHMCRSCSGSRNHTVNDVLVKVCIYLFVCVCLCVCLPVFFLFLSMFVCAYLRLCVYFLCAFSYLFLPIVLNNPPLKGIKVGCHFLMREKQKGV